MLRPPWTDIGSLQSDISKIENDIRNKADSYEIHDIKSRLKRVESEIQNIGYHWKITELENRIIELENMKNKNVFLTGLP